MNNIIHNSHIACAVHNIVKEAFSASSEAGWWDDDDVADKGVVPTKIALMHSELSEALEAHRRDLMDDHLPHRKGIEVELADALIRIADLAGAMGLDLGGAVVEKMAYNKSRSDHKKKVREAKGGKAY